MEWGNRIGALTCGRRKQHPSGNLMPGSFEAQGELKPQRAVNETRGTAVNFGRCLGIARFGKMQHPQRDALGSPVGGGARSTAAGEPSNSVRTGFNASAQI